MREASECLAFTQVLQSQGHTRWPWKRHLQLLRFLRGIYQPWVRWAPSPATLEFSVLFIAAGVWKEVGAGHSTQSVLFVHNVQMACVPLKWLKISVGTMSRDVLCGLYRCWHQPCSLLPDAEQQTQHLCRGRAGPGPCPSGRITQGSSERQISLMPLHSHTS